MKRFVLMLAYFLLILAACNGDADGIVPISPVADVSDLNVEHDFSLEIMPSQIPPDNQKEEDIATDPFPAVTTDTATEMGTDDSETHSTATPHPYPGMIENDEPIPTIQPAYPVDTASSLGSNHGSTALSPDIPTYGYEIIDEFPHDPDSSIQGLLVDDEPDVLLEGSGLWGESSLRRVDLKTGEVTQILWLPKQYFGEGITLFDDRIVQLTWKSGVGFVYDKESFDLLEVFNYPHEGWGITHDDQQLIVSDGTNTIHFWDPETLQEINQIQVYDEYGPVTQLNELEYLDGEIYANVWQTDTIVRINPETGRVNSRIDLTGLLAEQDRIGTEGVLNGIAYDFQEKRLFVTGKRWPKLFEIEIDESE